MQAIKLTFQDGYEHKMDLNTTAKPGVYQVETVPDDVGTQLAQYFERGRREQIMREHGRIKEVEVIPYQPLRLA